MKQKYHQAAEEAGVYLVSACGFDSIPNDIGVLFTKEQFQGDLQYIESYLKMEQHDNQKVIQCINLVYQNINNNKIFKS